MDRFTLPKPLWVALIASAVIIFGTLMPWVTVLAFSANGTQTGDGKLVLVLGVLAAVTIAASWRLPWTLWAAALVGVASLAASLYDTIHVSMQHTKVFGDRISASPGAGLWLDLIASAVLVGALVVHYRARHSEPITVA